MVIRKQLTLEIGEGDSDDEVHIQISTHGRSTENEAAEEIWELILKHLIHGSSSLTVTEW